MPKNKPSLISICQMVVKVSFLSEKPEHNGCFTAFLPDSNFHVILITHRMPNQLTLIINLFYNFYLTFRSLKSIFSKARVRINYKLNISNLLQIPVCVSSLIYFIFEFAFMTLYNPSHYHEQYFLTTDKTREAMKCGTEYQMR